jgi:hypothetical protein
MRYLFYSCCFVTPHFETEMEIASKAIKEGHEVFFVICEADLKTCFVNPEHKKHVCIECQSKIKNGLKFLNIGAERILKLSQFKFDGFNSDDYSFSSVNDLKEFKYKQSDIGLAVASSLISSTRDHQFDIEKHKDEVNRGVETAIMTHERGEQILNKVKPDVVIMFNGRFLEYRPIMRLCEKKGIDFYTHERGGQIDRYIFRLNSTPHSIAFAKGDIERTWLAAGDEKYTIGRNFYLDRRNKVVQSWSVFTDGQKDGLLPAGFDKKKKNIGFFNSSMDEYEGIPDFNNPLYKDDNDGIEKICLSFLHLDNYHFYLRVHPNLKGLDNAQTKEIEKLARLKNLTIIRAEENIDTYALMEAVDVVVTFGSTTGIEAVFWNKPSLLLGRIFHEDLDGIIKPKNHDEAVNYIKDTPIIESNDSALKYGYWAITFGTKFEYFEADGLFTGKFIGKRIKPSIVSRLKSKINIFLKER